MVVSIVASRCSAVHMNGRSLPFIVATRIGNCNPYLSLSSILPVSYSTDHARFLSSGRSRKRPRPGRPNRLSSPFLSSSGDDNGNEDRRTSSSGNDSSLSTTNVSTTTTTTLESSLSDIESDSSLPYPKGKPWRVLWPRPHGIPNSQEPSLWDVHKRIPTKEQVQKGWSLYKETWEDGITGIPTAQPKDKIKSGEESTTTTTTTTTTTASSVQDQLHEIGDNATKNLHIVRKDAQELLEHTKERTGIRTQDDLKALASEAMKIATECIREFMAGYRTGRDSEIDKMLHEYFQDEDDENNNATNREQQELGRDDSNGKPENLKTKSNGGETPPPRTATMGRNKKRRPKRGIPRD